VSDALLAARGLSVGYARRGHPARTVLAGVEAALAPGRFVCLLGPNGAGKSTLIRTLAGMQPPLAGEVFLDGQPMAPLSPRARAARLALVLTTRADVGMMTVAGLAALGRHPHTGWSGRLSPRDHRAVDQALAAVGLSGLAHRPVCELSDGERQKVMIARALAQEPRVLILDEATAFLDLPRRVELMGLLRGLAREHGRAVLLSTHDLDLALRGADRLWLLPPGGPLAEGAPEDLALSGALDRVFQAQGVRFDRESGSFSLAAPVRGDVALHGDGLAGTWAARALRRAGYRVEQAGECGPEGDAPAAPGLAVEVVPGREPPAWRVRGEAQVFSSLEGLLARLADLEPDRAGGTA
jgi:iron complex transport system ATP-binding protein